MNVKLMILFLIVVLLLSGCVGSKTVSVDRMYFYNTTTGDRPFHDDTLVLRTDGTFIMNTVSTYSFGYVRMGSNSGTYTETEKSVILDYSIATDVLTKNKSDLIMSDGDRWRYVSN
jgi:hypothetical protein